MSDAGHPTPDLVNIAESIRAIERALGSPGVKFTEEEAKGILDVVEHKEILIEFAKYQAARNLIWAKWRGLVIALAALITAVWALWEKLAPLFAPWVRK